MNCTSTFTKVDAFEVIEVINDVLFVLVKIGEQVIGEVIRTATAIHRDVVQRVNRALLLVVALNTVARSGGEIS